MNFSIDSLKDGIKELIKTHGKTSKAKIIHQLFDLLNEAMNEKVTLDHLVDYFQQQGLIITKNYLRNALYRIRKEKGLVKNKGRDYLIENNSIINNADVAITPVPIKTSHNITSLQEKEKRYHEIKHALSVATTWREKYIIMGGDPEKIKDMGESQILHMYTALQKKFVKEYKPFLKSN
ncbi:hypothetical protein C9J20_19540 [Photobacterium phosphoreum]|jgi:hypothetical protein|uniref:hypothetical protein n=1 Tax=Photobacterium phosphoreum TaxID=659 RepID=UPI000D152257|nr:hypothetical protein [Photobacterium phosphoreum]PSU67883.1 hypothetical protein CTM79_14650 [Photobacterium phosphoreum]PSW07880.1 hypothetical protein C9J20_19540 [Photobacterium phosphoreum]